MLKKLALKFDMWRTERFLTGCKKPGLRFRKGHILLVNPVQVGFAMEFSGLDDLTTRRLISRLMRHDDPLLTITCRLSDGQVTICLLNA